jgi:hypothetical protein
MGAKMAPLGKVLLFCCIALGLMTICSAAIAQGTTTGKNVSQGAEWDNYASFGFSIPEEIEVVGDSKIEENYSSGRELAATMLLDGKVVGLHVLYPCQAPQRELERAELKPYLEAYDPIFAQAAYNETVPGQVLLGQIGNQNFIAYQPTNLTVALVMMDANMSASLTAAFLDTLKINVNEGITPPGNCPGSEQAADTTVDTTEAATTTAVQENPAINPAVQEKMTAAEKMKADRERIQAAMNAARKKL